MLEILAAKGRFNPNRWSSSTIKGWIESILRNELVGINGGDVDPFLCELLSHIRTAKGTDFKDNIAYQFELEFHKLFNNVKKDSGDSILILSNGLSRIYDIFGNDFDKKLNNAKTISKIGVFLFLVAKIQTGYFISESTGSINAGKLKLVVSGLYKLPFLQSAEGTLNTINVTLQTRVRAADFKAAANLPQESVIDGHRESQLSSAGFCKF